MNMYMTLSSNMCSELPGKDIGSGLGSRRGESQRMGQVWGGGRGETSGAGNRYFLLVADIRVATAEWRH